LGFEECFFEDECFFFVVVVDEDEDEDDVAACVSAFGVAAGAGAADCWANIASGRARAIADRVTFFISSSPFDPGQLALNRYGERYAGRDERNMNARG
jgi:hypothetical protein